MCAYLVKCALIWCRKILSQSLKSLQPMLSQWDIGISESTCKLLAEVPAGSRINFEGLAFPSKAILRKETFGCCGQPPSSTPSTEQLQHFGKNPDNPFNPPPPGGGGGSDPTPPRFFWNNFFIFYCIDMKLGTPLRASIWRRLVQRKSKSAGNFLL